LAKRPHRGLTCGGIAVRWRAILGVPGRLTIVLASILGLDLLLLLEEM
jgi:hypothetical protein